MQSGQIQGEILQHRGAGLEHNALLDVVLPIKAQGFVGFGPSPLSICASLDAVLWRAKASAPTFFRQGTALWAEKTAASWPVLWLSHHKPPNMVTILASACLIGHAP